MSFVVAHAAHAWLELAAFAPPIVVVLVATVRSFRGGRGDAVESKETR